MSEAGLWLSRTTAAIKLPTATQIFVGELIIKSRKCTGQKAAVGECGTFRLIVEVSFTKDTYQPKRQDIGKIRKMNIEGRGKVLRDK